MQCMKIYVTVREQREQGYREPSHRLRLFFGAPSYLPFAGTCSHPHRGSGWACRSPLWCLCGYRVAAALMPFVASSAQHPRPPRRGAGMGESSASAICWPRGRLALRSVGRAASRGAVAALGGSLQPQLQPWLCFPASVYPWAGPPCVCPESSHLQSEDRESCRF